MTDRFIFTVATGRCGQASLTDIVQRHVRDAYAAFEEPRIKPVMPGPLGDLERHLRRRFVETDELLGRGKVLKAFVDGDDEFIERIVERRLSQIERILRRNGKHIYFDVSKYFARGLHVGYRRKIGKFGLVLLVRDPLKNMRSFLNRNKNFYKDNTAPNAERNCLRLPSAELSKGELYLWAWFEMYLRFLEMREWPNVTHAVEIRSGDLTNIEAMSTHLCALSLESLPLVRTEILNTNVAAGHAPTIVTDEDVKTFERFVNRIPPTVVDRIGYLKSYHP